MSKSDFIDLFNENSFPKTVPRLKRCHYNSCPLKPIIELNPDIDGNEACRTNGSRQGTKVIKANRFAHGKGTVIKYRDMCGVDVDILLMQMPKYLRKMLKEEVI